MILARIPRPLALFLVFVVLMLLALLLAPFVLLPVVLGDSTASFTDLLQDYYADFFPALMARDTFTVVLGGGAAIWSVIGVLFLAPITGKVRTTSDTRSLLPSVIAAIILGALLCGIIASAAVELFLAFRARDAGEFDSFFPGAFAVMTPFMLTGWVIGGFLVAMCLRGVSGSRNPNQLERILRVIFAGTVIELVLGVPIYLLVRRKSTCECVLASFYSMVFGVAALLWLCGPWALLFLTREARRGWQRAACPACGYPRRSGAWVCSECGAELPPI